MAEVKQRRIMSRDLDAVAEQLNEDLDSRKSSSYRKASEAIWREVDRQIAMEEMTRVNRDQTQAPDEGWQSVLELGELSMASELYSADIRRILFPMNRTWFEGHAKIELPLDVQSGVAPQIDAKSQDMVDGALRAFMSQQHLDFGLKARVGLSVKEALHHGSYVATVEQDTMEAFYEDGSIRTLVAPVWKPHSMWNCYPDPSPSAVGENLYYQGTMFIVSYMSWPKFKQLKGKGFWPAQLAKVEKQDNTTQEGKQTKDVEIISYYGDVYITRGDGDIFLPNLKCQLYNGVLCFAEENPLPYKPILFRGWVRDDVRDPYYKSPIMKYSPWQKVASVMTNRFVSSVDLAVEPPIAYDANDPAMTRTGGPPTAPGSKFATNNANLVKPLELGNAEAAMAGVQFAVQHMNAGLSVTPMKQGQSLGDRATAEEVQTVQEGSETRTIHFIDDQVEALRCFLYMQHSMNVKNTKLRYDFYNPEMGQPDFMKVVNSDLPREAHFEVVGARGVISEAQRAQKTGLTVAFLSSNPLFAPRLDPEAITKQMLMDAGWKNPEQFMKQGGLDPQVAMMVQQMQKAMQEMQAQLQQAESGNYVKLFKAAHDYMAKMTKIETDARTKMAKIMADSQSQHADRIVTAATEHDKVQVQRQKDGSIVGTKGNKRITMRPTGRPDGSWEGVQEAA